MRTSITRAIALAFAVFFIGISSTARAVPGQQDRDEQLEAVIVTGSFVTQGGAKDVNYLRGEVEQLRIPHPGDVHRRRADQRAQRRHREQQALRAGVLPGRGVDRCEPDCAAGSPLPDRPRLRDQRAAARAGAEDR